MASKRFYHRFLQIIGAVVFFISLLIVLTCIWTHYKFGSISLEQLMCHIGIKYKKLFPAEVFFIKSYIKWVILPSLLSALYLLFILWNKIGLLKNIPLKFRVLASALVFMVSIVIFSQSFSAVDYLKSFFGEDYFAKNYVSPKHTSFEKTKSKSLVLIYVESLEETYSNSKIFKEDLIKKLSSLKNQGVSVDSYRQSPTGSWTMGAIVATQCGVPLKVLSSLHNGNTQGSNLKHFLPNAICLSDILKAHGYTNVFMGGAPLFYAGKRTFLQDHHYDELYGRKYWLEHGEKVEEMNDWGINDDNLLVKAEQKINELAKKDEPFNLTILTLNTHHPSGFLSPSCSKKEYPGFEGVIKCSSDLVYNFVNHIIEKGLLSKVNIVILGDHLAMKNPLYDKLEQNKDRTMFNLFISKNKRPLRTKTMYQFDVFPTLLDFVGLPPDNGKLALGYSIFEKEIFERTTNQKVIVKVLNYSEKYNNLWSN